MIVFLVPSALLKSMYQHCRSGQTTVCSCIQNDKFLSNDPKEKAHISNAQIPVYTSLFVPPLLSVSNDFSLQQSHWFIFLKWQFFLVQTVNASCHQQPVRMRMRL